MLHCMCRHLLNATGCHRESIEVDPGRLSLNIQSEKLQRPFFILFLFVFDCLFVYPVYLASQNRDTAVKFTSTKACCLHKCTKSCWCRRMSHTGTRSQPVPSLHYFWCFLCILPSLLRKSNNIFNIFTETIMHHNVFGEKC